MAQPAQPPLSRLERLGAHARRLVHVWQREIWLTGHLKDPSLRGRFYATLRVISITWTVFFETKAVSRAASLSFSSLLGLGPMIALTVLVAGFMIDRRDPSLAVEKLNSIIKFLAPQISQLEELEAQRPAASSRSSLPSSPSRSDLSSPRSNSGLPDNDRPPIRADRSNSAPSASKKSGVENVTAGTDSTPAAAESSPSGERSRRDGGGRPRYRSPETNLRLAQIIDGFIIRSRSAAGGVFGLLTLIIIVLQLFTTVENAFNEIWGVRRGRTWLTRLVFYWTILTLGAVVFFAAITGLSAGAFFNTFQESVPYGAEVASALRFLLPSLSVFVLIIMLTLFFRYIPNTRVLWRAALIGAAVVTVLLLLNQFLAFFYLRRLVLSRNLYGSLALPLVLMSGLYIFWLFILIGGQLSYAVQNVQFRNSQAAWSRLSESKRERFSLVLLLTICRRFQSCLPPVSAPQLGTVLKVPTQIINEALNRLVDMKLITPIPSLTGDTHSDTLYQPARPLSKLSLWEFKSLDDNLGDDVVGNIEHLDPIVQHYVAGLDRVSREKVFQKNLEELLVEFPFDESRPPFAMGERQPAK